MRDSDLRLPDQLPLLTDPDLMETYILGWRGERGKAEFVARPRSTEEVSQLVAWCVANGVCLVPQSGRTGLVGASVPSDAERQAVVSLENLRENLDIDRVNRSLRTSSGFRLSEINNHLDNEGLSFPIDLSADPCIGGMIATNTGGSRLLRYGDVRQSVMELTVVLGDQHGTIIKLGAPWRKYASGPDWKHMFIGTSAAFGIITECVLSVELSSKRHATALLAITDEDALPDVLVALERRFGSMLSACEFMSAPALRAAWAHSKNLRKPFAYDDVPALVLLVEISCDWEPSENEPSMSDRLIEGLTGVWSENDGLIGDAIFGRSEEFWAIRHAISEGVRVMGRLYAFDLSFNRGDVMKFRKHMKLVLSERYPDILVCDFGHVGDGGIHFNLVDQSPGEIWSVEREQAVRDLVVETAVEAFGGCFSAEHGVGPINFKYFERYAPIHEREFSSAFEAVTSQRSFGRVHFGFDQKE